MVQISICDCSEPVLTHFTCEPAAHEEKQPLDGVEEARLSETGCHLWVFEQPAAVG